MQSLTVKIEERLNQILEERKLFLVELKILPGNKIEVFVDGDQNVTIDACAKISRKLEEYLDEEPTIPPDYKLEVSSPGMSNPLRVPRQYKKRVGRLVEVTKADGTKLNAKLLQADDSQVELQEMTMKKSNSKYKKPTYIEGEKFTLSYSDIKKTVLQFDF